MDASPESLRRDLDWERAARKEAEAVSEKALRGLQQKYQESLAASAQLDLFHRVAAAANEADSPDRAYRAALRALCETGGWQAGHVLVPASDPNILEPTDLWHLADGARFQPFRDASMRIRVARGQGVAGRAFQTLQAAWVADTPENPVFPRAESAAACGLRAALAFPVVSGRRVLAVLELFGADPREPDRRLSETLSHVGRHLGRFVDLLQADAKIRERDAEVATYALEIQHFITLASHDLQEPLRLVTTYVELLERRLKGKLDPELQEFLTYAAGAALRMKGLLTDFLTYARLWSDGGRMRAVPLKDIVNQVLFGMRERIRENGALVTIGDLPTVRGDVPQLVQLFEALLDNALKFRSAETPRIEVAAEPRGPSWQLRVADNGIGIHPEYQDNLFWLFRQVERDHSQRGTGLGLARCRRIVERHGGRIWVESTPGEGATFLFTLPGSSATEIRDLSETRPVPAPGSSPDDEDTQIRPGGK